MAKKKEPPKPMASLRFDFVDSLEQAILMLQAVDTVVQQDDSLKPGVRDILAARSKALRAALISEDE